MATELDQHAEALATAAACLAEFAHALRRGTFWTFLHEHRDAASRALACLADTAVEPVPVDVATLRLEVAWSTAKPWELLDAAIALRDAADALRVRLRGDERPTLPDDVGPLSSGPVGVAAIVGRTRRAG